MLGEKIFVRGASRTDAGVHALAQVANFRTTARIPVRGFLLGLNSNLPPDIAVVELADAGDDFDARLSARGKVYRYQIWNHLVRTPIGRRTSWHCRAPLDLHAMREAAALLIGEHDFRGFRAADCQRTSTVRRLTRVTVDRQGPLVVCEVEGTAFLKYMVRIIAGTLVAVGRHERTAADVAAVLSAGDRTQAGITAPAAGLTLVRVLY
jgi:tRNA pseudouridine38-40 synthase